MYTLRMYFIIQNNLKYLKSLISVLEQRDVQCLKRFFKKK